MDFFLNERLLLAGRTLKCLLLDQSVTPDASMAEIGAQFQIVNAKGSVEVLERRPQGVETIRNSSRQFRFSAAEWESAGAPVGPSIVECRLGTRVIARRELVILAPNEYNDLLKAAEQDKIGRPAVFRSESDVGLSWSESWRDLATYLSGPYPDYLEVYWKPLDLSARDLSLLVSDAFAWISFLVNRFLFNQIFYGGEIRLERTGPREALQLISNVRANVPQPFDRDAFAEIKRLVDSLEVEGHRVALSPVGGSPSLIMVWS